MSNQELSIPLEQAKQKIEEKIQEGLAIRDFQIQSEKDLKDAQDRKRQWEKVTEELLRLIFGTEESPNEFQQSYGTITLAPSRGFSSIDHRRSMMIDTLDEKISCLRAVIGRLDLRAQFQSNGPAQSRTGTGQVRGNKVFLVHGHDNEPKHAVARFLDQLGLQAIILHDQADGGRTIIEKFEAHSEKALFAVVLLTPDDTGYPGNEKEKAKPRARQNVVLELGYFLGRLGRRNVCALKKGDVEIPSDYSGVVFVAFDESDGWKTKLVQNLRAAQLEMDEKKLLNALGLG